MQLPQIRIDQALPSFGKYDAIGNEVQLIGVLLEEAGIPSDIYVESKSLPRNTKSIFSLEKQAESHIVLYHFSTGSDMPYFLLSPNYKVVSRYHNITPCDYFHKIAEPGPYEACMKGRLQIPLIHSFSDMICAASRFNAADFAKHQATEVLPVLRHYDRLAGLSIPLEKSSERPKILFVGRLTRHKNVHLLFFYLSCLKKYYGLNPQLILVGSNDLQFASVELPRVAEKLGLVVSWNTKRHSEKPDIMHYTALNDQELSGIYRQCDLFLCLSEHEGFCVPLVEAMFFDIPILANTAAAIPETLGESGMMIDVKKRKETLDTIAQVLTSKQLKEKLISGQKKRRLDFKWETQKNNFSELLSLLVKL